MSIKRITIDLDDRAENLNHPTEIPKALKKEEVSPPEQKIQTGELIQESDHADQTDSILTTKPIVKEVGRTYSDLFIEIKEDPRCVATFFTLASFIIYSFQMKNLKMSDFFIYVAITATILNIIWLIAPNVLKRFHRSG